MFPTTVDRNEEPRACYEDLRFNLDDGSYLTIVTMLAAWIYEDDMAPLFDRLYMAPPRIFHQASPGEGTALATVISSSIMRETSLRTTTHPHTMRRLDRAAHRFITPMLDMIKFAIHADLQIMSTNMAIPACKCHSRQFKVMQRPHDHRRVRHASSRLTAGPLYLFCLHRSIGPWVSCTWRVIRRFTDHYTVQSAHDVNREHSHRASHRMR